MGKQVNPNIGHTVCGFKGCVEIAAVRKDRNGSFYQDCLFCGRLTPNVEDGQNVLITGSNVWSEGKPTAGIPRWIAEQWSWQKARHKITEAMIPYAPQGVAQAEQLQTEEIPQGNDQGEQLTTHKISLDHIKGKSVTVTRENPVNRAGPPAPRKKPATPTPAPTEEDNSVDDDNDLDFETCEEATEHYGSVEKCKYCEYCEDCELFEDDD